MKITRDNTQKKIIINNILNKIGLPATYSSKIIDDLIKTIISNIIIKKKSKLRTLEHFS